MRSAAGTIRAGRRSWLSAGGLCLLLMCLPTPGQASDWVFQRSYYSHAIPPELESRYPFPESRSAYRRAILPDSPGISFRHARRYNRVFLQSGNSTDVTIYQQHWFQARPTP